MESHWYATSPYLVDAIKAEHGRNAYELCHTVASESWERLCADVRAQVELYKALTGEGS
ncbi:hypothetical protein ACIQNG_17740 [Streptomyces sp. NPDC091377]|uniref:hypothetical protein n=1 Tax=Streptomyces sp. NPDC091377 TaxID=3365995 RepID=UPI00382DEFA0